MIARSRAKFRIVGRFDNASAFQEGTVTIDRANNVVEVRPLRRRKTWLLTLDAIVDAAVRKLIAVEVRETKKAKRKKK